MNPETAREDVLKLEPGAAVVYDEPLKLNAAAHGPALLPRAVRQAGGAGLPRRQAAQAGAQHDLRRRRGPPARHRHGGDPQGAASSSSASSKAKAAELNWDAAQAGFDFAAKTFTKTDPFRVERMNATAGKIIIDGNAACALGAMFAGVTVVTWYPITPSSSLVESLIGYLKRYRIDPETGKATYAIVQAEDELASIGMAIGAGWAGRALHDRHRRAGHLADVRVHRPRLLRRSPGGDLQRAARRALHRPAHAHRAGRHALHRAALPRRHQAPHVLPVLARRVLHAWPSRPSTWPSSSRPRSSS